MRGSDVSGPVAPVCGRDAHAWTSLVSRIALTRPSLARQIEELLVRMARSGQLKGKVGDTELKGLLEQVHD